MSAPTPTSTPTASAQVELHDLLVRRIRRARPDLARRYDLSGAAGLRAVQEEAARGDGSGPISVVAVVRRFDLTAWVCGTCVFAAGLDPDRAAPWRRAFTRTLFLAGDPGQLRERFTFDHISADETLAWVGPAPDGATTGLRRLLKTYDGARPLAGPPRTVRIPALDTHPTVRPPMRWRLPVTTVGVTVADALIHLNHLLSEAVLDGLVAPGDELQVQPVPRLVDDWASYAALRISTDSRDPDRLRAYAGLIT